MITIIRFVNCEEMRTVLCQNGNTVRILSIDEQKIAGDITLKDFVEDPGDFLIWNGNAATTQLAKLCFQVIEENIKKKLTLKIIYGSVFESIEAKRELQKLEEKY